MKSFSSSALATVSLLFLPWNSPAAESLPPFVYENPREFFVAADLDGDGRKDAVIVDKDSGKYRIGYQLKEGVFTWVDNRPSGIKGLSGFTVGRLLNAGTNALAFTSPDANQITVLDASNPTAPSRPVTIPFTAALGPNTIIATDIGGDGNTPLADLAVGSIYNSPDQFMSTLIRNDGNEYPKLSDESLPGQAVRGNRVQLKSGGPELVSALVNTDAGDLFVIGNLAGDSPAGVGRVEGLPAGSDYVFGDFAGKGTLQPLVYKPGEKKLALYPVTEGGDNALGASKAFELEEPVVDAAALGKRVLVIQGTGAKAGIYDLSGDAPKLQQTLLATNDTFTCALDFGAGFVMFWHSEGGKYSTKYQIYTLAGNTYNAGPFGALPNLADNDNITIPDIHARIAAANKVASEAEMKGYTNTIPGTRVSYAMVKIPGGEFMMGSPDSEPGRKPDESPQHKVKVSPFWMGQFEITWNEYELFMYPDEEKRTRATLPTDASGDKLADAVSHPSKPYVEMSFGMGKDGYPAISMTQHAANKYCQWLSAKTGHFYRLPTEAEWEYACRAGTTGVRFFGDDDSKLPEYAWFEENSDFKYQKVGKKKPNPWGLYDIYGNVVEWVLDQYDPEFYKTSAAQGTVLNPWNKATKPYPHSVRGGSWDDQSVMCRSAARRGSDRAWKMQDPQLPKSIWYFSDAQWVGFRIVRPLKVPSAEEMQKYWTSGVERD